MSHLIRMQRRTSARQKMYFPHNVKMCDLEVWSPCNGHCIILLLDRGLSELALGRPS